MSAVGKHPPIRVIMATDAKGLEPNATVLNSLRRHHPGELHVRIFVRDMPARDIRVGNMRIEFIVTREELRLDGKTPEHVASKPVIDRMAGIEACSDWDRALVLDYDQLVVGDLSPLFSMEMGDALAAGRIWGKPLAETVGEWFGRRLPHIFRHCADYRLLVFGPLVNLAAMREFGFFEKFQFAQRVANSEEQISFHIACEDRVMGISDIYNLIPMWDGYRDDAVVYHYTGVKKPWHEDAGEDGRLWKDYQVTWSELTGGPRIRSCEF